VYLPLRPTLSPLILLAPRRTSHFQLNRQNVVLYEFSKNGIWKGISVLGLAPGDKVLVPSYICRSALKPIYDFGLNVIFFRINERLEPDRVDLEGHLSKGAKALLFVHYFGFPQNLGYFADLRSQYEIPLIEDCAHAFLGCWEKTPLGSIGDISIFCPRKFFPLPDGGAAFIKKASTSDCAAYKNNETLKATKGAADLMVRHLELRIGMRLSKVREVLRTRKKIRPKPPVNDEKSQRISRYGVGISPVSSYLLRRFNPESVLSKRRENYRYLLNLIENIPGITPVFGELSDNICPQVLPIFMKDRDDVVALLQEKGIEAGTWPRESDFVPEAECETAKFLAGHILLLPIHQELHRRHLDWCAEQLTKAVN